MPHLHHTENTDCRCGFYLISPRPGRDTKFRRHTAMKLRLVVRVKKPRTPRMLSGLKAARSAKSWGTDKNRMYGGWREQDAGERR